MMFADVRFAAEVVAARSSAPLIGVVLVPLIEEGARRDADRVGENRDSC